VWNWALIHSSFLVRPGLSMTCDFVSCSLWTASLAVPWRRSADSAELSSQDCVLGTEPARRASQAAWDPWDLGTQFEECDLWVRLFSAAHYGGSAGGGIS
jgi:hypothetical protein